MLNAIYLAVLILASPWIAYRALTTNRYRQGLGQKLFGRVPVPNAYATRNVETTRGAIWLHGVSVGEIQLLKPLLQQLRAENPHAHFVVSTTTQTGMELAQKIMTDEWLIYYPLDFTWSVNAALARIKPSLIILGELELWPNFIRAASHRKIPVVVVNARLSERSFRGYQRWLFVTRKMFAKLRLVAAQDESYAERFRACGVPAACVRVTGSLKFDNVTFDRQCDQVEQLRRLVGLQAHHIVWIAGSTQSPEELTAAQAFKRLRERYPDLRLVVVPRHPERFEAVHRELKSLGLDVVRRSTLRDAVASESWHVLLVDTVGELRWWWGLAELALVGGSFGNRGGQNMLEPAAYGANVAFGPNTVNFRDISQLLLAHQAAIRLADLTDILPWMEQQLADRQAGRERGERAQALVRSHQGALQSTCRAISEL